ncbi:hypothetical protein AB0I30_35460 [Nocardia tengchongensis]|uniref:hypothetical protein n=1 Tax=Nocardia tengchongensis TaxID=2055889 RepID=UPI0033CAFDC4
MTMTKVPTAADPDLRPRACALITGGVLFAVGNALHPLEHSEAAEQSATWAAAHLTFGAGAILLAAGLPVLTTAWRSENGWTAKLAAVARALLFVGLTVAIPVGAYHEIYVAPRLSHHEQSAIEAAALPVNGPLAAAFLLGFLLLAACALAAPRPLLGRPAAVALIVAVVVMAGAEGLPGPEGWWIIPGTMVVGLVLAVAGARALGLPSRR